MLMSNGETAVAIAAKSVTNPLGHEIRVVYIPTGEVIFSKAAGYGDALSASPSKD